MCLEQTLIIVDTTRQLQKTNGFIKIVGLNACRIQALSNILQEGLNLLCHFQTFNAARARVPARLSFFFWSGFAKFAFLKI
jgi:hypothetical protein